MGEERSPTLSNDERLKLDELYECVFALIEQQYTQEYVEDIFESRTFHRKHLEELIIQVLDDRVQKHLFEASITGRSTGSLRTQRLWSIDKQLYVKTFEHPYQAQLTDLACKYFNTLLPESNRLCCAVSVGRFLIMESAKGVKLYSHIQNISDKMRHDILRRHFALIGTLYCHSGFIVDMYTGHLKKYYEDYPVSALITTEEIVSKLQESLRTIIPKDNTILNQIIDLTKDHYLENVPMPFFDRSLFNEKIDQETDMIRGYDFKRFVQFTIPMREYAQALMYLDDYASSALTEELELSPGNKKQLDYALFYCIVRTLHYSIIEKSLNQDRLYGALRQLQKNTQIPSLNKAITQILL